MSQLIVNVGSTANDGTGTQLRPAFQDVNANFTELYGASGGFFTPVGYNVDTTGATDCTTAMQAMLDAAVAAGGIVVLTPGTYRCGLLTDTASTRLQIIGQPGAVIAPTGPTWLKVVPGASAKFGVRLDGLVFSLSHCTDMTPVIWLEGSSSGGVVDLDIHDIDFGDCAGQHGDLLWLRACWSGSVGRLFCVRATGMKGIVYTSLNFNSGNIRFYDITLAHIGVALQMGRAYNATTNQQLLNQILCDDLKFVRSAESLGMHNPVTLTSGASALDTTLTVSSGDATAVANALAAGTPQFAVCADPTYFGDVIRVLSAASTTITLAAAIPSAIANGTIVYIGTIGAVIGANTRGVQFNTVHVESTGVGILCSGAQQVQILNGLCPVSVTYPAVMVYATNGTQHVTNRYPLYSGAATALSIHEIVAQGTVTDCDLVEPASMFAGSGPAHYVLFTGSQVVANRNKFIRSAGGGATIALTYGTTITPDESYDLNVVTVTDGTGFTVANAVNRFTGRRLLIDFYNNSGGAMGTVTFGSVYKLAGAFTAPATGEHRLYEFVDGFINGNIREVARSVADIVN